MVVEEDLRRWRQIDKRALHSSDGDMASSMATFAALRCVLSLSLSLIFVSEVTVLIRTSTVHPKSSCLSSSMFHQFCQGEDITYSHYQATAIFVLSCILLWCNSRLFRWTLIMRLLQENIPVKKINWLTHSIWLHSLYFQQIFFLYI